MAEHGSRQSYADGCRCPSCKAAQSQYRREHKARQAGAPIEAPKAGRKSKSELASVTQISTSQQPAAIGPNEAAVLEELATLTSAETRKAAAQGALTLARIADNPLEPGTSRKGAVQEFVKILEDLRKGSARRKGRLASVQAIAKSATGTDA